MGELHGYIRWRLPVLVAAASLDDADYCYFLAGVGRNAGHRRGGRSLSCKLYRREAAKAHQIFLATDTRDSDVIRVELVKELNEWVTSFCTNPVATVERIREAFADQRTIEQNFHDQNDVRGAGQQQVRNIWTNVGVFLLNLWRHAVVKLWARHNPPVKLCGRTESSQGHAECRPSPANPKKVMRQQLIRIELRGIVIRHSGQKSP